MSGYTDHFAIIPDLTTDRWTLVNPLVWDIGKKASGLQVVVPSGFKSDLATIPWFVRWLFRTADPRYAKASVLHDWLLASGHSPITAAAEFTVALKADGVSNWRAIIMGLAVLTKS